MATNTFKSFAVHNVGTGTSVVRTVPALTIDVLIGLRLVNLLGTQITATAQIIKAIGPVTVNILAPNTPIPAGSAISAMGDNEKIVLETGDILQVTCSAANGADAIASMMEQT